MYMRLLLSTLTLLTITLQAQAAFPESRGKVLDRKGDVIMLSPVGGYLMTRQKHVSF